MLAYVFWHWPEATGNRRDYESRLLSFHEDLAGRRPAGFFGSAVLRGGPVPWAGTATTVYEDWYLLGDSAGLDILNEAALAGTRRSLHDGIAELAAGGTAGLYRLRCGTPAAAAPAAHWFAKPRGMSYTQLDESLARACARPPAALWGRQMVLGPTPEFCLLAPEAVSLPPQLTGITLNRELLWTEANAGD